jgi:uncharacterized spore protein YtfJ
MNVDEMVKGAQDAINVKRVFGDPIEKNGVTIIPAAKVTGGGGGGADSENNGGGGFGVRARPAGVYIIRGDEVKWEPAIDINRAILGGQIVAIFMLLALRAIFGRRK